MFIKKPVCRTSLTLIVHNSNEDGVLASFSGDVTSSHCWQVVVTRRVPLGDFGSFFKESLEHNKRMMSLCLRERDRIIIRGLKIFECCS